MNEVDLDKNIIYLTSLDPPVLKQKEKLEIYAPQVFDEKVKEILGADFSTQLRNFLGRPEDTSASVSVAVSLFVFGKKE